MDDNGLSQKEIATLIDMLKKLEENMKIELNIRRESKENSKWLIKYIKANFNYIKT